MNDTDVRDLKTEAHLQSLGGWMMLSSLICVLCSDGRSGSSGAGVVIGGLGLWLGFCLINLSDGARLCAATLGALDFLGKLFLYQPHSGLAGQFPIIFELAILTVLLSKAAAETCTPRYRWLVQQAPSVRPSVFSSWIFWGFVALFLVR